MGKKDPEDEIFEFRIKFYHSGSDFINQRHFMALNHSSALNMFDFASRKDSIEAVSYTHLTLPTTPYV